MASKAPLRVLLAEPDPEIRRVLQRALQETGFCVSAVADSKSALDLLYADPPQGIVLRHGLRSPAGRGLLDEVKSDNVYGHLPVILIFDSRMRVEQADWTALPADDYLVDPVSPADLASRMRLCWARASRDLQANPLTGLPGNWTITCEAERRLAAGQPFAVAYADLNGFKAYNDTYGFTRGDEVLRMTARLIVNSVRELDPANSYVGHIGGDDFVFVTAPERMAAACERIISTFDLVIRDFYDETHRSVGFIESRDRHGMPRQYPLMTCSIGAIDTDRSAIGHVAELFGRLAELKSHVKRNTGSAYLIDRRK